MDISKETPPSNADLKIKKKYQRYVKKICKAKHALKTNNIGLRFQWGGRQATKPLKIVHSHMCIPVVTIATPIESTTHKIGEMGGLL